MRLESGYRVLAGFSLLLGVIVAVSGGLWEALIFVLFAALALVHERVMDSVWMSAWTACSRKADDLHKELGSDDEEGRAHFYLALMLAMPDRHKYNRDMSEILRDMAALKNPTDEEIQAVYRKHRPPPS